MRHTSCVRVVGIIFVLAASAAIQLPWFSCHSDCQHAFLPVWDLGLHHCHDEAAHAPKANACPCCPDHGDVPESEGGDDHDHGRGDHETQLTASRRPASQPSLTPELAQAQFAVLTPCATETRQPLAQGDQAPGVFDTGPPERLASVRLLL